MAVCISLNSSLIAGSTQSAWIEALYKRDLLNKLKLLTKSIKFLQFCKHIVFRQLKLGDNSLNNFQIEDGTVVICRMTNLTYLIADKKIELYD